MKLVIVKGSMDKIEFTVRIEHPSVKTMAPSMLTLDIERLEPVDTGGSAAIERDSSVSGRLSDLPCVAEDVEALE